MEQDRLWTKLMAHGMLAGLCIITDILIFVNYAANIIDPEARGAQTVPDIITLVMLLMAFLTMAITCAYTSIHEFLLWHGNEKKLG